MNAWSQSFLWASLLWGSVGSGYLIYGWKQRALIPFFGGLVMTAVSCVLPALPMSLACLATMLIVWWLLRQGY
jgi:thiol:disulfide interchange protein